MQAETIGTNERKTFYDGEIHKCPNCGEILKSFELECSSCGFEFRGIQSSKTLILLYEKLNNAISEQQKIEIIRNFPIPNTKEDIVSFMNWAVSNYDGDYAAKHQFENDISDAYFAVAENCYHKARMLFRDNSQELKSVAEEYAAICEERDSCRKLYKKVKKKQFKIFNNFSKQSLKNLLSGVAIILTITILVFAYCYNINLITFNPNAVVVGISSKDIINKDCDNVIETLVNNGFSNIERKEQLWNKDFDVGVIINFSIDGKTKFVEKSKFDKTSKIIINYNGAPKQVKIGLSSSEIKGQDYQHIVNLLKSKGFVYIETKDVSSFLWLDPSDSVKSITINGIKEFLGEDSFSQDSQIVIEYYR